MPNLLDFIETFASRARDLPLLLVTLSRPELLDTRPGWATGLSAYTALTVPRLGDEHARELARCASWEMRTPSTR